MFKILLIMFGSIFVGALLISSLTFFFYIKKIFITDAISFGLGRREAIKTWRQSKFVLLRMAFRIVFRGEK